ncbi:FAD-dependent oxidoreductase [Telluribacter sp.]|jgi:glycine/D-amino acid oxidase-like deaminating enzyme/nitrite reductase/ring-hydroxylating ferredoxin subunit|uniref:FAD-dependent oxidoreductase n=1 Tax=Telluribacter sp. TaxID=1978767 RepID=UPI002E1641C4|nr:FAD-dependent oxidoreductase [Telluribacter sp.]
METKSFWEATIKNRTDYPSLEGEIEVDVAIIGGGITGITTALLLTEAGKKVAILEARRIGGGTTGWSSGNLYVPVSPYYQNVKDSRDTQTIRTVAQARGAALDFIEQQVSRKNIDCGFSRRPWHFFTYQDKMVSKIEKEVEALREAGLPVDFVDEVPPLQKFGVKKAARMDGQARFHPLRYILALAENITQKGAQLFEYTTVYDYKEEEDYCVVKTTNGSVKASQVVVATHLPIGLHTVHTVAAPYRSYAVAVKLRGEYPDAYFWHNDGFHKTITTHSSDSKDLDILMVVGNHHKTGQASQQEYQHYFKELEEYARRNFEVASVEYQWSAQHYHSGDGVPYIGKTNIGAAGLPTVGAKRTYMATSYDADGLTYGTVAGIHISNLILGREDQTWVGAFDPTRIAGLSTVKEFIKENANVAVQYVKGNPFTADVAEFGEIEPGEGKTIKVNGEKLAVYRDEANKIHACSAVCPHLLCTVNWNNAEKTWDCPCHGSRFMIDGTVIEGPAIHNLEKKEIKESE